MGQSKLAKALKGRAASLLESTPQNVIHQAETFVDEVAVAVKAKLDEKDMAITKLRKEYKSLQNTKAASRGKASGDPFYLEEKGCTAGMFLALFRVSALGAQPVRCIFAKALPDHVPYCGAHCVGFQLLGTGNVVLCNGRELNIVEKE